MKKITYPVISIIILILITACAEYKPIYTTDLQFRIADYSVKSNNKLGRKIYTKLYNLSKFSGDNAEVQNVNIIIDAKKVKKAIAKDSTGKILEYRIILNSNIMIKDYLTNEEILKVENLGSVKIDQLNKNKFDDLLIYKRALHVVTENQRTKEAKNFLLKKIWNNLDI